MAHSIFVALFLAFLTKATVNFPCEQIESATEYDCWDVGWCKYDWGSFTGRSCVEDTCVKTITQSGSCADGCSKDSRYYDWDCATDTHVNESGFFCIDDDNYFNDCFYNGTLTNGSCGRGCKNLTLEGKTACVYDYDYDECNEYDSEDLCNFKTMFCFWQNGKCVRDWCSGGSGGDFNSLSFSHIADCFPHTNCIARDVHLYDGYSGEYFTEWICLDPAHTTYQKCHIEINEYVRNDTGSCWNTVVHNEYCTDQAGCKVITFEGKSICSSLDAPSSSFLVQVPSVFVLLAVVLALFFAP